MKRLSIVVCVSLLCACSSEKSQSGPAGQAASSGSESRPAALGGPLGTIRFPVTGNSEAARHIERGVKLLHHMTYTEADREFAAAVEADPDCAMGYWGRAMTIVRPVWPDVPNEARLRAGWDLIVEARARGVKTPREAAYVDALAAYFADGWNRQEKDRLADLDRAWEKVHAAFPDDLEAACFYALFHLAPARFLPKDKSYRVQLASAAIVEDVLRQVPDHPGAQHYKIHAYDFPALAGRALEVCASYGSIAPEVPHALHMPTHIYTRLGLWDKSIELNLKSAAASLALADASGGTNGEYLHALDYAVYAYLQRGQYEKAAALRDRVLALEGPFLPLNLPAAAFAFSAIPARCALERQQWAEAARLKPRAPAAFPWQEGFIPFESIVYFARALGALRAGDLAAARADIEAHRALADRIAAKFPRSYWEAQAATQGWALQAWRQFLEGDRDGAVATMRKAADLEAETEKEAVTPGEVLPEGELYGDMLMELGRPEEAVAAYEAVMQRSPNRFNSLFGAGRAAEAAGDRAKAGRYFGLLAAAAAEADPGSAPLDHAREFLAAR